MVWLCQSGKAARVALSPEPQARAARQCWALRSCPAPLANRSSSLKLSPDSRKASSAPLGPMAAMNLAT